MRVLAKKRLEDEPFEVNLKHVVLNSDETIRAWLFGPGLPWGRRIGAGYLTTHPELEGHMIWIEGA